MTDEDVYLIKQLLMERWRLREQISRLTDKAIAEKFGVAKRTIAGIACHETWLHVPWDETS